LKDAEPLTPQAHILPRRLGIREAATLFTLLAAAAFLIVRPPVGDLWAARARESAALHGVGLRYWFSWFGGTVPGSYSVLAPYLSKFVDAGLLGAVASVVITLLCHRLVRGSAHPAAATWLAAAGSSISLWSGRVPFAAGTALMVAALIVVRADRRVLAPIAGAATALVSPVSGAFLILGLIGVLHTHPQRRVSAGGAVVGTAACLGAVALYFGMPGPEGFISYQAVGVMVAIAAMLFARPAPYVRTVLLVSLAATPVIWLVPNGMGSNFERFTWICLPVATLATARSGRRVAFAAVGVAVSMSLIQSGRDLIIAAQPMSTPGYYADLISELDHTPGLRNHRLEVVPDGTHAAAYTLLDHAMLARGYETQADNQLNGVLSSSSLDAVKFKIWLNNNAVGYVAIDRQTLQSGPEDRLVRSHTPSYLHLVWTDTHWRLYRVSAPTPIVAPPARLLNAGQAALDVATPRAVSVPLRVRWSHFLQVRSIDGGRAHLESDGRGWTTLVTTQAGRYRITG
jgi:hypothetical protein